MIACIYLLYGSRDTDNKDSKKDVDWYDLNLVLIS